jgi:hypothetical protein
MTARTSAHLAPLCDDLMSEMQKIKGEERSRLFYECQAAAVDRIEEIQNKFWTPLETLMQARGTPSASER